MIEPIDEIIVDLNTSCTKEVAVAKLLGWVKGPIRSKVIKVTEHGISEEQLPFLHSMDGSLQEQRYDLREAARQEFVAATEADATFEVTKMKEEAVTNIDSLIGEAFNYSQISMKSLQREQIPQ